MGEYRMKLAIMQPYFFPYIGYFQLINAVDKFVIYDDVNFIVRGWINRNNILLNGKKHKFTLPLKNASQNRIIKDIKIDYSQNWQNKLIKTLIRAYKKAHFYNIIIPIINKILDQKVESLSELACLSIQEVCLYLGIQTNIIPTSSIYSNCELSGQDRIIDICRRENAEIYINAIGGVSLYSRDKFQQEGIRLSFIQMKPIAYQQNNEVFIPNLSIIDVMMFNSVDDIRLMLDNFELI